MRNAMLRCSLALVALIALPARSARAEDFVVSRDEVFAAPAEALLASILAYDEACDRGCRYAAPHVAQAMILSERRTPEDFFVWTFVKDVQNTSFFSHLRVTRSAGLIHLSLHLVGPKFAAVLQEKSGKPHAPNFDDAIAIFDLEEQTLDGRVQTRVHHENKVVLSGFAALFGAALTRDRLEESVRATFENFRSVK